MINIIHNNWGLSSLQMTCEMNGKEAASIPLYHRSSLRDRVTLFVLKVMGSYFPSCKPLKVRCNQVDQDSPLAKALEMTDIFITRGNYLKVVGMEVEDECAGDNVHFKVTEGQVDAIAHKVMTTLHDGEACLDVKHLLVYPISKLSSFMPYVEKLHRTALELCKGIADIVSKQESGAAKVGVTVYVNRHNSILTLDHSCKDKPDWMAYPVQIKLSDSPDQALQIVSPLDGEAPYSVKYIFSFLHHIAKKLQVPAGVACKGVAEVPLRSALVMNEFETLLKDKIYEPDQSKSFCYNKKGEWKYLDANSIKFDNENRFIATAHPFMMQERYTIDPETREFTVLPLDPSPYWQMLFLQDTKCCVSLVTDPYWPSYGSTIQFANNLYVTCINQAYMENDLIRRDLLIQQGSKMKQFTHFEYSAWPDMKAIEPEQLKKLVDQVKTHRKQNNIGGALTVHCMGGAGRTGTFINAYVCKDHPDINKNVIEMRKQRPGKTMVETKEQFDLIDKVKNLYFGVNL